MVPDTDEKRTSEFDNPMDKLEHKLKKIQTRRAARKTSRTTSLRIPKTNVDDQSEISKSTSNGKSSWMFGDKSPMEGRKLVDPKERVKKPVESQNGTGTWMPDFKDTKAGNTGLYAKVEKEAKIKTSEEIQEEIEKEERKQFLIGFSWDEPFKKYGEKYTLNENSIDDFTVEYVKEHIDQRHKSIGYLKRLQQENQEKEDKGEYVQPEKTLVLESIKECITNGDSTSAAKKCLNLIVAEFCGFYKFLKRNPEASRNSVKEDEIMLEKTRKYAIAGGISAFKGKHFYVPDETLDQLCQEGGYAHKVVEDTVETLSDLFEQYFTAEFGKSKDLVEMYRSMLKGETMEKLLKQLESDASLKGYATKAVRLF